MISHCDHPERTRAGTHRRALPAALAVAAVCALLGAGNAFAGTPTSTTLVPSTTVAPLGEAITLTATVTTPLGSPNVGVVRFSARTGTTAAVTIASVAIDPVTGTATTSVTLTAGTWVLSARYLDPTVGFDPSSSPDVLVTVSSLPPHNTTTTVSADPLDVETGRPVTITAHVRFDDGFGIPSGTVTFTDNGVQLLDVPLDANGDASVTRSDFLAGTHAIVASYLGVIVDRSAPSSGRLTLLAHGGTAAAVTTTTRIVLSPDSIVAGDAVTISAHVVQTGTATPPLGDNVVTFLTAAGVLLGQAPLDANGDAQIVVHDFRAGSYTIVASYAGNERSLRSSDSALLNVYSGRVPAFLTLDQHATADYHDAASFAATLSTGDGSPLAGRQVTLTIGGHDCGALRTDASGGVVCRFVVDQPAGTYPVHAAFAGDAGAFGVEASEQFVVTPEQDTLSLLVAATTLRGSSTLLAARLLEDGVDGIGGRAVTLSLGAASCAATTNAAGVAACAVPGPPLLGPTAVGASFPGDATYLPAQAAGTTLLYSTAPGTGSFVIGDRTATGTVTFWGSQWSKVNLLGATPAPSAFKGYALLPAAPACGVTWSTDPSNSPPPPAAPLPTYMAVVVTGASSSSGSLLTGNSLHVVVVRTDPGYDASPGHPGTGTVVATVC